MRIGIDGRGLQYRLWGGVRHYTLALLQALFTLDCENEYHVFYNAWKKVEVPQFSEYPQVTIHYSRWPNKFFNLSVKLFGAPTFHPADGSLDLLLAPNLNFIVGAPPMKLVTVAHDLSFEHFPEYFSRRLRLWHRAVNPRALFLRADHIIAVSHHTKSDLMETYGIAKDKVTVIYPGINDVQADAQNNSAGKYILYLGALEPRKNIQGVIAAYEALRPREQLVIAGLTTSYVRHLKQRIAKSRMREKIVLIENPSEEHKHALLSEAALFVYPSFYEGFGFPPLEAMACGVPVVASSASAVPEICGDAAILVNPWQVQEIKEGIKILLEDSELRKKYIAAGISRVREFSWRTSAEGVLKVFKKVMAS